MLLTLIKLKGLTLRMGFNDLLERCKYFEGLLGIELGHLAYKENWGIFKSSPPRNADSWAMIPGTV